MSDEGDSETLNRVLDNAPTKLQAFTVIAARTNMSRIGKLHRLIADTEDHISERMNELTPSQLLSLRGYLERDLSTSIDKMLPKSGDGKNSSPNMIMNFINAAPTPQAGTPASMGPMTPEARERVRNFVRSAVESKELSHPKGLHVVQTTGTEKK